MAAQRTRHFERGLTLTETEFRRLHKDVHDRLTVEGQIDIKDKFTVYSKNHVRDFSNIDEVLRLENHGKNKITRVRMQCSMVRSFSLEIELDFSSELVFGGGSQYYLRGLGDDNMHITASILEERLSRLFNWSPLAFLKWAIMLCGLLAGMTISYLPNERPVNVLDQLEQRWKGKELTDPIEFILALERAKQGKPLSLSTIHWERLAVILFIGIMISFLVWAWPPYNFVWGDNIKSFERKQKMLTYVLGSVIISGLLLPLFRKSFGF